MRVTSVDSGHNIRGSWGDTRALHATMEDDVRIKVKTQDYQYDIESTDFLSFLINPKIQPPSKSNPKTQPPITI